jgi:hypothetical protein
LSGLYNEKIVSTASFEWKINTMKKITLLLLLIASTHIYSNAQVTPKDFTKLQWLVGEWNRTNAKAGISGTEKWITKSDTELQGWGIRMRGKDTAFVEKTKLVIKENSIYYVADVPENKEPVFFKLTSITNHSFTCENSKHDFPKKIVYTKENTTLKATISGDGKSIDYFFERNI